MTPKTKMSNAPQSVVNDVAGPNIVGSIPVHTAGAAAPAIRDEDDELDRIMQDVGRELKSDAPPSKKHHLFGLKHHQKKEANFSIQPILHDVRQTPPAAAAAPAHPTHQVAAPPPPPKPAASPPTKIKPAAQRQPKPPKPVDADSRSRRVPVLVTLLTIIVTSALIAAAIQAYR